MENEKKAALLHIARITGILVAITTITATLLAVVNMLTAPVISKNDEEKKQASILELFPTATDITPITDYTSETVTEMYSVYANGVQIGYCGNVSAMGFSDEITMMVGVTADKKVSGIRVLSISDTPGLGMKVAEDTYLDTYKGTSLPLAFGENADAISGATYSSRGILNGVNAVLTVCETLSAPAEPDTDLPDTEAVTETTEVTDTDAVSEEVTSHE